MPRTLIEPHKGDKRFVRRKKGKFTSKQVSVGRSLAADRRKQCSREEAVGAVRFKQRRSVLHTCTFSELFFPVHTGLFKSQTNWKHFRNHLSGKMSKRLDDLVRVAPGLAST